ncbi:MAG: hypothetical protein IPK85_01100 [Gemmatimonadetes bacterium]|nr:hypothetical protein [Gemmatimonadota bacterium]
MRHHFPRPLCLLAALLLPVVLPAQGDADSLRVEIAIDTGRYLPNTTPIEIRLHRVLRPDEGALVLMVGGVDVTGLAERLPTGLRYRPGVEPLPHGQTEVVAYRTTGGRMD